MNKCHTNQEHNTMYKRRRKEEEMDYVFVRQKAANHFPDRDKGHPTGKRQKQIWTTVFKNYCNNKEG